MTMTHPDTDPPAGPYATAAHAYRTAGWYPLPLPYGQKKSPPNGWTGRDGAWPSGADVQAWVEDHAGGNIALRMPPNVLGVDVDDYKDKPGAAVLDALQDQHGLLPPTWTSSSRGGRSGIRFYRVPEGLRWPGVLGPGIETIRYDHRYAVAWPSLHPEGGTYRWTRPDGATALDDIPQVDELPPLPHTWVEALTGGLLSTDQPRADLSDVGTHLWLTERYNGQPCRVMRTVVDRGWAELRTSGSRHDTALALTNRIIWLAGQGHTGVLEALVLTEEEFNKVTADRHEDGEWERMISGAVRLSAAAHPNPQPDPCNDPWAGILKEQPWISAATSTASNTASSASPTPSNTSPATSTPLHLGVSTTSPAPTTQNYTTTDAPSTDAPAEPDRTSWWPRHPDHALNPDSDEPGPTILQRDDGQNLFYPGRINGLIAPSESGKTWIALHAVTQAVNAGHNATILDFEDTHRGVTARLQALGLTDTQIRDHIAYIGPDEPLSLHYPTGRDLTEHLNSWDPAVIILDGVNAAMGIHGLDLISNKDATTFAQHVLRPLTTTGACVIYVDHTPKDKDSTSAGGIGAQAKRAMTTGCAIRVHVNKQFGKGQNGTLTLNVDKDRQGDVRGASKPSGEGGHWAGTAQLTSHQDGTVTIVVESPDTRIEHRQDTPIFRPTVYMERVSQYIQDNPGQGRNIIVGSVRGTDRHIKTALSLLVSEGWVRIEEAANRKQLHYTTKPYSDLSDLTTSGGGSGGEVGAPPPPDGWGRVGADTPDVVGVPTPPPRTPTTPQVGAGETAPTPLNSHQYVKRVLNGVDEVWVNLATGEVHPIDLPPPSLR
jgi:hypothetical protein